MIPLGKVPPREALESFCLQSRHVGAVFVCDPKVGRAEVWMNYASACVLIPKDGLCLNPYPALRCFTGSLCVFSVPLVWGQVNTLSFAESPGEHTEWLVVRFESGSVNRRYINLSVWVFSCTATEV